MYCNSCYFSRKDNVFCHKGYPHWAFRPACDDYYEIKVEYGAKTIATCPPSSSHTVIASETYPSYDIGTHK